MVQFQLWASIQQILLSTSCESQVTGTGLDLVTGCNRAAGKICQPCRRGWLLGERIRLCMKESYDYEATRLFGAPCHTKQMEHARRAGVIVMVAVMIIMIILMMMMMEYLVADELPYIG